MEKEKINHPSHYGGDTVYEAIKVIEAWGLNFNLGNSAKYICRAGKKGDALEDLKKAQFYLNREIANIEKSIAPVCPECGALRGAHIGNCSGLKGSNENRRT